MTRAQEIQAVQFRYLKAVSDRKPKTAGILYARLKSLMARQLKAEIRMDRKAS